MRAFDQFRPTQPNPTQCFSDPSDEDLLGHGCQSFFALLPEASHRMPFASSKLFQSARTRNLRDVAYLAITIWALAYLIIAGGAYVFSAHPPYDARGLLLGLDFVNTWASGRAALTGNPATWFDASVYNTALHATFGPSFPTISQWFNNWSYPPDILLFTWVLGLLPYFPAYTLWSIIGFAIYYFVVTNNEGRFDRILFLAAAPAVTSNLLSGQNGFFTAALMIGGLSKLDKNPVLAGIFFGLLTLKPQLCLLVPVMLCVTKAMALYCCRWGYSAHISCNHQCDFWHRSLGVIFPNCTANTEYRVARRQRIYRVYADHIHECAASWPHTRFRMVCASASISGRLERSRLDVLETTRS